MKRRPLDPPIRPDVELRIVIIVAVTFLVIAIALGVSTLLWPAHPH